MNVTPPLLQVRHLVTEFKTPGGRVRAVNDVSFDVHERETLAIVGESGSGKSMTMLSIMQLIPKLTGCSVSGEVWFEGTELLGAGPKAIRAVRGAKIAMIFQDPTTCLNPVLSIGVQICEALRLREPALSRALARQRAAELLAHVTIANPRRVIDAYPHQLSGGMCQRVMLAIAISGQPRLLIADEPTTALDTTTQLQLLELVRKLQRELSMAVIWISHDLGVVAGVADRVLVMYAGAVVESAPVEEFYRTPLHPYSRALLRCVPRLDRPRAERLESIGGSSPDLAHLQPGCAFAPRCAFRVAQCERERPPLLPVGEARSRACWVPSATITAGTAEASRSEH